MFHNIDGHTINGFLITIFFNMKSYMFKYSKWNGSNAFRFHIKSFLYVFNEKEKPKGNWTLYTWLFT